MCVFTFRDSALLRRHHLKSCCNLRLPRHLSLAPDLGSRLPLLRAVEEDGSDHELGAHDSLMVVDVGGAVGAIVAIDILACLRT